MDDDQDKVQAWLALKGERCPSCGTAESDWLDANTKRLRDDPRWEAVTWRCHGCEALEAAREEVPKKQKGVRVLLVPTGEAPE